MKNKSKWVWTIFATGDKAGGSYEGDSLSEVVKSMCEHCVSINEYPREIVGIFATTDIGKEISLRSKVVSKVNKMVSKCVDEELAEWNRKVREYENEKRELRSEYYASVL